MQDRKNNPSLLARKLESRLCEPGTRTDKQFDREPRRTKNKKERRAPLFSAFAVELAVCCSLFNHSLSDDACYFEVDFLVFQVGQDVGVFTALAGNDVGQFQLVQLEHDV